MTIYASKTPRDLNHDPLPFAVKKDRASRNWMNEFRFEPRPEFDHVQHHPVNPILADVRRYREERQRLNNPKGWAHILRVFMRAADHGQYVTSDWERFTTPEMLDHARKVLTRLAALEESHD